MKTEYHIEYKDYTNEINELYERIKLNDVVYSKERINAEIKSIFSLSPYFYREIYKEKVDEIIFGLKDGLSFTSSTVFIASVATEPQSFLKTFSYMDLYENMEIYRRGMTMKSYPSVCVKIDNFIIPNVNDKNSFERVYKIIKEFIDKMIGDEYERIENEAKEKEEFKRKEELKNLKLLKKEQNLILDEFDKDGNGTLDVIEIEDEFLNLLQKHQHKIIETDKTYIEKIVKISDYHKTKRKNLQTIFDNISKTKNDSELNELVDLLKEQIHSYESLIFHSLNMISSLINDDLITFYQIHTAFDKLNIFNSNHQNEVSNRLKNIEEGIYNLVLSMQQMESEIISELNHLSYINQSSYENLSLSVNKELEALGSSINTNNLLTAINTYQNYSTNRRLNS